MQQSAPNIFQYLDYRKFLMDFISNKKDTSRKYSYRYFSSKAGFKSSNFLSLVVKGKRNLTICSIGKIAQGLRLKKQERSFFEDLVLMNQADVHDEKDYYYQKMLQSKPFTKIRELSRSKYDYFSKWYNPVIREIVDIIPGPADSELIAELIRPRIKRSQVEDALALLLRLNLIKNDADGGFSKTDAVLSTGDEIQSMQIMTFHKTMIELAIRAISEFSSDKRDFSGLVLGLNSKNMLKIKQKISAFRKELAVLACEGAEEDQVIYIQINAFPLMQPYKEE